MFVCPSVYEPLGIVNLEAMACETAVVATATGGIPEVVVNGETGLLVPFESDGAGGARDPDRFAADIAERLNSVLADPDLAEAMGRAGRRRAVEQFSWTAIAAETAALRHADLAGRVQLGHQPGGDDAVGVGDQLGDLVPVDRDVEVDAEPAAVADVRRPEEPLGVGGDQRLLVPGGAAHQKARRSSWWWSA